MKASGITALSGDQTLGDTIGEDILEMIKSTKRKLRGPVVSREKDAGPAHRLRSFLEERGLTSPLAVAQTQASVDGLLTLSLLSALKISPEALSELQMVDRCLLSLLTIDPGKLMSTGRLAWLASDIFVEITVNLVRERMAAIGASFAAQGRTDLLAGDYVSGYRLNI